MSLLGFKSFNVMPLPTHIHPSSEVQDASPTIIKLLSPFYHLIHLELICGSLKNKKISMTCYTSIYTHITPLNSNALPLLILLPIQQPLTFFLHSIQDSADHFLEVTPGLLIGVRCPTLILSQFLGVTDKIMAPKYFNTLILKSL